MARTFAEFRKALLEPEAAKTVLRKKKNLALTEKQVYFKTLSSSKRKLNYAVINPGPKKAHLMFQKAFEDAQKNAPKFISKALDAITAENFDKEKDVTKALTKAIRFVSNKAFSMIKKLTPGDTRSQSRFGLRPGGSRKYGRVKKNIEMVPAAKERGVKTSGEIGNIIRGNALHTFNVEMGFGKNQVVGKIKLNKQKRKSKRRKRRGR